MPDDLAKVVLRLIDEHTRDKARVAAALAVVKEWDTHRADKRPVALLIMRLQDALTK